MGRCCVWAYCLAWAGVHFLWLGVVVEVLVVLGEVERDCFLEVPVRGFEGSLCLYACQSLYAEVVVMRAGATHGTRVGACDGRKLRDLVLLIRVHPGGMLSMCILLSLDVGLLLGCSPTLCRVCKR